MKSGDLVRVDSNIGLGPGMELDGKIGFVIGICTLPGYLGSDEYFDVLIEGIRMSIYRAELHLIEDD